MLSRTTMLIAVAVLTAGVTAADQNANPQRICGLGIGLEPRDGQIVINRVIEGSPAAEAELPVGCILSAIDNQPVRDATPQEVVARLAGKVGESVELTLTLAGGATRGVRLTRAFFDVPGKYGKGVRIDYILANEAAAKHCVAAQTLNDIEYDYLSDHYPVMADFAFDEPNRPKKLRVVTYNVLEGFQFEPARQQEITKKLIALKPDVVALQELNGFRPKRLREWARQWDHEHVCILNLQGYPVALTSSAPITHVERWNEGYHHGVVAAQTHGVQFFALHLIPGQTQKCFVEVRQLAKQSDSYEKHAEPRIMLGDFNTLSPHDREYYEKTGWQDLGAQFASMELLLKLGWQDVVAEHRDPDAPLISAPTPLRQRMK